MPNQVCEVTALKFGTPEAVGWYIKGCDVYLSYNPNPEQRVSFRITATVEYVYPPTAPKSSKYRTRQVWFEVGPSALRPLSTSLKGCPMTNAPDVLAVVGSVIEQYARSLS